MKYLKREGCPWPYDAVEDAASFGQIQILEWLRSEGETFDEDTCCAAIEQGQLETLKWLKNLDSPCPWDKNECRDLAIDLCENHIVIVRWIDEQEE